MVLGSSRKLKKFALDSWDYSQSLKEQIEILKEELIRGNIKKVWDK
jgi:hypothetical protein